MLLVLPGTEIFFFFEPGQQSISFSIANGKLLLIYEWKMISVTITADAIIHRRAG